MTVFDRLVREISAPPVLGNGLNPFSAYTHVPNIVLLGEPGAGKTHLFKEFARFEQAEFLVARSFLNFDNNFLAHHASIYIDALDERRSGNADHDAVDDIVKKLFQLKREKVRISCRSADWLGETDLSVFKDYFDRSGGHIVLSLQPLSDHERVQVLTSKGVNDPNTFLSNAIERGLENLLGNPQTLIMLADVVGKLEWPSTRTQLYEHAATVLLDEHSAQHSWRERGKFTANELRSSAGELCAVRLISDIYGISLTNRDQAPDLPSFRNLISTEIDKARAALTRRAFTTGPVPETVDYTHRTIAEFLAAAWIAQQVRRGLPIGRVRALIGLNGRPASELRGLHAWLTVHLPECAEILINADPFGVLSYGDARSLSSNLRMRLLESLARLADSDPWFRSGEWSLSTVAALSGPDMDRPFAEILGASKVQPGLRMLVLDSMRYGYIAPELTAVLYQILLNRSAKFIERESSIQVLIRIPLTGAEQLLSAYPKLSDTADDLRLSAAIFIALYGRAISIGTLAKLFARSLRCIEELPGGALWGVARAVPEDDVPGALDELSATLVTSKPGVSTNASEVVRELDLLLIRALQVDRGIEGARVLSWLELRLRIRDRDFGSADELAVTLHRPHIFGPVLDAAIQSTFTEENRWVFLHHLIELGFNSLDQALLAERLMVFTEREPEGTRRCSLYEVALTLAINCTRHSSSLFEDIFDRASGNRPLEEIRSRCCYVEIPAWRQADAKNRISAISKRTKSRESNASRFEIDSTEIRAGTHERWLEWIGQTYFALFSDVDRLSPPRGRLIGELGEENCRIAIEGLVAFVVRGELTSVEEITRLHGVRKHRLIWYAAIAGLDEYVRSGACIDDLPLTFLKSALAVTTYHPMFVYEGNHVAQSNHLWKDWIYLKYPEIAVEVFESLSQAGLAADEENVYGLDALLNDPALYGWRENVALRLLEKAPRAKAIPLGKLLKALIDEPISSKFRDLIQKAMSTETLDQASLDLWYAAGYLTNFEEFSDLCREQAKGATKGLVWALRDLVGDGRSQVKGSQLSILQTELLLRLIFKLFVRSRPPERGWSGDTNDWDATEYALRLIASLSADPTKDASLALSRLAHDLSSSDFMDDLLHARAQQAIRLIDAQYCQPGFATAVASLRNQAPVEVGDLYALLIDHLEDLCDYIAASNSDVFKRFWNEDRFGRVTSPKGEESCRDCLVEMLRTRTNSQSISIEPEGHMAADKRADIVAFSSGMKVVVELKRDYHADVWSAIENQLTRYYTRDPQASGYGIYLVLWFGDKRTRPISRSSPGTKPPATPNEMQLRLIEQVPDQMRPLVKVIVLDVSGEIPVSPISGYRQT